MKRFPCISIEFKKDPKIAEKVLKLLIKLGCKWSDNESSEIRFINDAASFQVNLRGENLNYNSLTWGNTHYKSNYITKYYTFEEFKKEYKNFTIRKSKWKDVWE